MSPEAPGRIFSGLSNGTLRFPGPPLKNSFSDHLAVAVALILLATYVGIILAFTGKYNPIVVLLFVAAAIISVMVSGIATISAKISNNEFAASTISGRMFLKYVATSSVIGGWVIWISSHVGSPILLNRDPGGYYATSLQLLSSGALKIAVKDSPFYNLPEVELSGPASYLMADGTLEFQFSHGPSVLAAAAVELFGPGYAAAAGWLFFLCGALAIFDLLRACGADSRLSLASLLALFVSIPVLYVARSTYSEPFVFGLIWVAASQGLRFCMTKNPLRLAISGFLIGGTCCFRIDGLLYVAAFFAALAVAFRFGTNVRERIIGILAAVPGLLVGTIDHWFFTGRYASDLRDSYIPLAMLAALAGAFLVLSCFRPPFSSRKIARFIEKTRPVIAVGVGAAAALVFWFALFWRPHLFVDKSGVPNLEPNESLIAGLQQRGGLEMDSSRTYNELSLVFGWWYLGPVLLLGSMVGLTLLAWSAAKKNRLSAIALTVVIVAAPVYVWRMSIFPDQPWATRRFVPFIFPVIVILSALGLTAMLDRFSKGRLKLILAFSVSILTISTPLVRTASVHSLTDQRNGAEALSEICDGLGNVSHVLILENARLLSSVRGGCEVEVGYLKDQSSLPFIAGELGKCVPFGVIKFADTNLLVDGIQIIDSRVVEKDFGRAPFQTIESPVVKLEDRATFSARVFRVRSSNCPA